MTIRAGVVIPANRSGIFDKAPALTNEAPGRKIYQTEIIARRHAKSEPTSQRLKTCKILNAPVAMPPEITWRLGNGPLL